MNKLTNDELDFMNEGTVARYNRTFQTWPSEDVERYWSIVDKFNQSLNPALITSETNQL